MAGAGYKLFNTGDVLTAAQVNTYLQEQVVMVFANAAARTTALSGVLAEGMVSYLKDTDALEIYSGTAWVGFGSGDITGITTGASSGLTGGVTSGTADLKLNTTAKGGLLVGTGSGTSSELAVGSNNTVLTADSTTATGLKWAAAASGGGYTELASGSLSGSSLSLTSISGSYRNLQLVLRNWQNGSTGYASVRLNNLSTGIYDNLYLVNQNGTVVTAANIGATSITANYNSLQAGNTSRPMVIDILDYANTTANKLLFLQTNYVRAAGVQEGFVNYSCVRTTSAIDRIDFIIDTGTFSAGTYSLYGVK